VSCAILASILTLEAKYVLNVILERTPNLELPSVSLVLLVNTLRKEAMNATCVLLVPGLHPMRVLAKRVLLENTRIRKAVLTALTVLLVILPNHQALRPVLLVPKVLTRVVPLNAMNV
jgi:hypothetical protein